MTSNLFLLGGFELNELHLLIIGFNLIEKNVTTFDMEFCFTYTLRILNLDAKMQSLYHLTIDYEKNDEYIIMLSIYLTVR